MKMPMLIKTKPSLARLARLTFLSVCLLTLSAFYGCTDDNRALISAEMVDSNRLNSYVDTRIGTSGLPWANGHVSPAAMVPFGLVSLGPDTRLVGSKTSSSGYSYTDSEVAGFSHLRYSGTGLSEGGVFRVTPANESKTYASLLEHILFLDHDREIARPGYYQIDFQPHAIRAEFTATIRGGYHRYHFAQNKAPRIIVEITSRLSDAGTTDLAKVLVDPAKGSFSGSILLFDGVSGRYKGLPVHFHAAFNRSIEKVRFFGTKGDLPQTAVDIDSLKETVVVNAGKERLFAEFEFAEGAELIELKLALSHVDDEGARHNFETELEGMSFEGLRGRAEESWEEIFSRARVSGGSVDDRAKFYTALYRSFVMPNTFSDAPDAQGVQRYRGYDRAVHASNEPYYANFSLWDTFRTTHPLYNLIAATEQSQMIRSLIQVAEQSGRFPRWGGGAGHADSMLGFPAHIMIAEAYLKGLQDFDAQHALRMMVETALPTKKLPQGQECLESYSKLGYCAYDKHDESVSFTLEYAYADFATAKMAKAMGRVDVEMAFERRSINALRIFDPSSALFAPTNAEGFRMRSMHEKDSSYIQLNESSKSLVEGSARQWRWYVPYRPETLVKLLGERFIPALEEFFENAPAQLGAAYPGTNYWHGNEPSLHAAYLFAFAGRPDLTQKWVRWIMDNKYAAKPKGLDGDDDAGTISSWFALSALGIYPLAGTPRYVIGSPLFERVDLQIAAGKTLVLRKTSGSGIYVKSVAINGKRLSQPWFDHSMIANGGEIVFTMSDSPSSWEM